MVIKTRRAGYIAGRDRVLKKALDFKSEDGDKFPLVSTSERDDTSLIYDRLRLQLSVN